MGQVLTLLVFKMWDWDDCGGCHKTARRRGRFAGVDNFGVVAGVIISLVAKASTTRSRWRGIFDNVRSSALGNLLLEPPVCASLGLGPRNSSNRAIVCAVRHYEGTNKETKGGVGGPKSEKG